MLSTELRREIERRALEIQADIEAKLGKRDADLLPDCIGKWHVVVTAPNQENKVVDHLAERQFGVYLPIIKRTVVSRGYRRPYAQKMFPGYVFVFGWGLDYQQRRILAVPGVKRLLHNEAGILIVVADSDICKIEAVEAQNDEEVRAAVQEVVNADERARKPAPKRSKRKKWKKKGKKTPNFFAKQLDIEPIDMTISTKSYWRGIEDLPTEDRISLLHAALGLRSSAASSPVSQMAG